MIIKRRVAEEARERLQSSMRENANLCGAATWENKTQAVIEGKAMKARAAVLLRDADDELNSRRRRLASLLQSEYEQFQAEYRNSFETADERMARLALHAQNLRAAREERRAKFAAAKIQQQVERGNDDLRCLRSKFVIQGVVQGRQLQLEHKAQRKAEQKVADAEYDKQWLGSMAEKAAREKREKRAQRARNTEMRTMLDQQVHLKHCTGVEHQERIAGERAVMKVRWDAEEASAGEKEKARRAQMHEDRQKVLRDNKAMREDRAVEKLRENEFDNLLLQQSLAKDARAEAREAATKQRLRDEARAFQKYLEEQMVKEASNGSELEQLRLSEQNRMWEKREAKWQAEAAARDALRAEVDRTRQRQLEWKKEAVVRERAETARLHAITMARVDNENRVADAKAEAARLRRFDQDRHIKSQMRERERERQLAKQAEFLAYRRTQLESQKHEEAMRQMQAKAVAELEMKRSRGAF